MKKKNYLIIALLIAMSSFFACNSAQTKSEEAKTIVKPGKVEVYYFHYTRRCKTCEAIEKGCVSVLNTNYAAMLKDSSLTFSSVNIDEEANAPLVEKCKADGQSLLIFSDTSRIDLTDNAFMNAVNAPDKFQESIKSAIDKLLKK
jgi:hypothetical protein